MPDELPEEETVETTESKIDATHRLQKSGLWDEASRYRTERRIQYRNAGLTKKEAGGKAWDDMRLKFPRPGTEPIEPPEIEMPEPEPQPEPEPEESPVHIPGMEGSMDVARDVAWAYEYLSDQNIRADQAPSAGAWNMLQYGRSARHKFLELVTRYDAQQKKEDERYTLGFTGPFCFRPPQAEVDGDTRCAKIRCTLETSPTATQTVAIVDMPARRTHL